MEVVLGLDIGTTSVKAVAVDAAGRVVATGASAPLSLIAPEVGWAVQNTAELSTSVVRGLADLVRGLPSGARPVALSAAVQSGSLVVADRHDEVARQLTTWMDTRTTEIVAGWRRSNTAEAIRRRTGWSVQPGLGLAQLVWLRTHDPRGWARLGRAASADDFVIHHLTGSWITNPSNAAGMQLLDFETGTWSEEMCELAEVSTSQLSTLRASGTSLGRITSEIAASTGLPLGLPVVAGGHDQTCTALALGVDEPGQALLAAGTAWVLTTVIDAQEAASVPEQMNKSFHVIDGLRTTSRYLGGLGASMEWWLLEGGFARAAGDDDRYDALDVELTCDSPAGDPPFFLRTSESETARPGAGRFWPANSDASRVAKALAIMEFAAFEVRTAIELLPATHRPARLTLVGGATSAPGWAQTIADVCSLPLNVVPAHSWPAMGAALLAGRPSGFFGGLDPSRDRGEVQHLVPHPAAAERYDHRYSTHLQLIEEHRR